MKQLTDDQITKIVEWLNSWEQIKGSSISMRFRECFGKHPGSTQYFTIYDDTSENWYALADAEFECLFPITLDKFLHFQQMDGIKINHAIVTQDDTGLYIAKKIKYSCKGNGSIQQLNEAHKFLNTIINSQVRP